ncbi:DUF4175 family protein [Marivirga salinae]|uniref:DUF4175 family protein n=1 Tax=Marivirga salinarum TaxID=3059078 RepID=A0AA51RBJ8_9BACT|nr:DUF4175 family protein [Marivirga sp. BDSF4-3]WMN12301.1 DUF4175 family protein [Marivirga sp. BDSF4-3]
MSENYHIAEILKKLNEYKRKYYVNKLIKGLLISLAIFLFVLLTASWLEYKLQMSSISRTIVFSVIGITLLYFISRYIFIPIYHLLTNGKALSDKQAAQQIGKYFPEIDDKLLNIIQLNELSSQQNSLIAASIIQKSEKISILNFKDSISIKSTNANYLPYVVIPAIIVGLILMFAPYMITEGSYRIIKFNEEFIPKAPFSFSIKNNELKAFKGENFTLTAELNGDELPNELFIQKDGVKQKFEKLSNNRFQFNLKNLQKDMEFQLEAAGFNSAQYELLVFEKPRIQNMNISLDYPDYIGTTSERINNSGNLIVPEGTQAEWLIQSASSDKISIELLNDSLLFEKASKNTFRLQKSLTESSYYKLNLFNDKASYIQKIDYSIEVIKDKYPEINLQPINDSIYFRQVAIAGEISDDYGFSRLNLIYTKRKGNQIQQTGRIPISFNSDARNQKYFKVWEVDSLLNEEGSILEYYVQVADNDGFNGAKTSKSATFRFELPNESEVEEEIKNTRQNTEDQLDMSIKSSERSNQKLEELEQILKSKRNLNWEDKKLLEEILKEQERRKKQLEDIKRELEKNQAKRDRFNKNDPDLKEKSEQLESLMEEMLQDENEELMEKIKSLLEEQDQSDEFRKSVEDLKKQEKNKLKEMERMMELFKRMEIQYDMKQVGESLKKLEKEQKELAEENTSEEKNTDSEEKEESNSNESESDNKEYGEFSSEEERQKALEEQKKVNEEFEKIQKELREIEKRNQSLKQPNPLNDTKEQESEIDLKQQNSLQEIQENNKSGASEQQKKSSEEMKKMSEMLSSMEMGMEMEMLQENIDDLKDIVDNLLKLSFRQEELMNNFKKVNPSDPRFITLSEKQLAMKDDAKIIEDSLTALAQRVFQLESFITKEMGKMNESMQSSIDALRERENGKAIGEQQFAMTSMNNLALMLDDVLEQMQMQMQSSMGMGQQSQGNQQTPSLSEMQKSLNQKTKELSQGQKEGRQFSEKLGELAGEQAKIRKMMEELEKQLGKDGEESGKENGGNAGDISEEMEKIEEDLVNKRLDRRLIERQQKIVTRLLESEKAREEQEEKDERKGETATEYERERIPNAFEEYIKEKEKEIEQLRNVPPNFTPYYKNEINKYYNRLKSKENLIR